MIHKTNNIYKKPCKKIIMIILLLVLKELHKKYKWGHD